VGQVRWQTIAQALGARPPERVAAAARRAAVAIILREGVSGIEVLFIHRAEHPEDPWSGHMAFPGGREESGETALDTAVREAEEEVGIALRPENLLGALDELHPARRQPLDLAVAPFVFRVGAEIPARPNHEVSAVCWLSLDDLLSDRYRGTYDYAEAGGILRFPCLRVEGRVIWGLTYRMFADLALRLRLARAGAI
jgi:8-oxo-dGTP pyrophosphatase MutT (NUDIX family)